MYSNCLISGTHRLISVSSRCGRQSQRGPGFPWLHPSQPTFRAYRSRVSIHPLELHPLTCGQPSIIAVTAAHAFGSWAHSSQNMWLRDYLPKDVTNARVLIYGYPSQLQGNISRSILSDHTNNFIHRLLTMRDSARVSILVETSKNNGNPRYYSVRIDRSSLSDTALAASLSRRYDF